MQKLKFDIPMLFIILGLIGYGISMNYSASSALSLRTTGTLNAFLSKHVLFALVGFFVMIMIAKIKYSIARKIVWVLNGITIVLLFLTYIPAFQMTVNDASRWVNLFGISFQPSEIAKITVVFTLAHLIDEARKKGTLNQFRDPKQGIIPILGYIGFYLLIVLMQKHLSAAMLIGLISITMLFIGGVKKRFLLIMATSGILFGIIGIIIEPFRVRRIMSFTDPFKDELGSGYQIIQSWYALGSGEWFGLGLGMSRQKFGYIPENHTDFIIAIIGEEMGFLFGTLVVIILFILFLLAGLIIASKGKNIFELTLVSGIVFLVFYQFMINLFVVGGIMPVTGMPLPFISYGGTSLVVLMVGIGLIFNVTSTHSDLIEKEGEKRNDEESSNQRKT
ncbi:cell division protein FtsW (plasmid) [Pontibacillus sp. ALD_SL1]|uniref:FtsW/RodA/SpoVE family cell cycle protein n=1 Tax=Pontibacillus sp. ALD_SL1 TaxID=2777185 RepID=UPI001A961E5D|nr:putative peptidoglycan glycosyltransferase FtsW [Pontibacillus sp. ALD_SL1]QST03070.1 cell division protein FtsW [Pontibacillus sp. ALD_SL1]